MKSHRIPVLAAMAVLSALVGQTRGAEGRFDGTVRAFRSSHVNAQVIGTVAEILVEEGQSVEKGQVLLRLDDAVERANHALALLQSQDDTKLKLAQAQQAQAERNLLRQKELYEKESISQEAFERAQYERELAGIESTARERELDRLKALAALRGAELNRYVVRAPFSGTIADKPVELGENTYPLDKRLFHLIDASKVYIEVTVQMRYLTSIKVGMPAGAITDLYPDKEFPGTVSSVSSSAITGGWGFTLKVLVDNPEGLLRPEMKASVIVPSLQTGEGPIAPGGQETAQ